VICGFRTMIIWFFLLKNTKTAGNNLRSRGNVRVRQPQAQAGGKFVNHPFHCTALNRKLLKLTWLK
jgi:hypothetical protein